LDARPVWVGSYGDEVVVVVKKVEMIVDMGVMVVVVDVELLVMVVVVVVLVEVVVADETEPTTQ
jgi:hypothetical protein